jgi:DNA polymerase III alpha subunit
MRKEIYELVNDAKLFDIEVQPPDFFRLNANFDTDGEIITFGLCDAKGVGERNLKKLSLLIGNDLQTANWTQFLIKYGSGISESVMKPLILVGALRKFGKSRKSMLTEYNAWNELTDKEKEGMKKRDCHFDNLVDILKQNNICKKDGGCVSNQKRVQAIHSLIDRLENPSSSTEDSTYDIVSNEEHYLGISITCSNSDKRPGDRYNTTCKDLIQNKYVGPRIIKVTIEEVNEFVVRNGKEENIGRKMAKIKVSDHTSSLDQITAFCNQWEEFGHLIIPGSIVEIECEKQFNGDSFIVKRAWDI